MRKIVAYKTQNKLDYKLMLWHDVSNQESLP